MLQHSQQVLGVPVLVQDTPLTESGHGLHSHSLSHSTDWFALQVLGSGLDNLNTTTNTASHWDCLVFVHTF